MNYPREELVNMTYALGAVELNILLASRLYAQRYPERRDIQFPSILTAFNILKVQTLFKIQFVHFTEGGKVLIHFSFKIIAALILTVSLSFLLGGHNTSVVKQQIHSFVTYSSSNYKITSLVGHSATG